MNDDIVSTFVEVTLPDQETFLKIKETLSRIGIASKTENFLYQSCHILHKKGKYYLVHFKELHMLDGKPSDMGEEDLGRRNTIAHLLQEWGLLKIVNLDQTKLRVTMNKIKIVKHSEKSDWTFIQKYTLGKYKK